MNTSVSSVVGLGRLVDLTVRNANGGRQQVTPQDERWLAWKPDTRDLVILYPAHGEVGTASRRVARRHQVFHGHAPEQARPMEWPTPRGTVRTLGLVESVTYNAADIRSPSKRSHHWIHHFGDRGERGHGPQSSLSPSTYAEGLMPRLDVDAAGNLFVTRRASNRYTVRDWIIG